MNNLTKKFIKKWINFIEEEDWKTLFSILTTTTLKSDEDNLVEDLLEVLDSAGINFMSYFNKFGKLSYEDVQQILTFLRSIGSNYLPWSGGPVGGNFISHFVGPDAHEFEYIVANIAKDLDFKLYKTDKGAFGDSDIAIIASWNTIDKFVKDLEREMDDISIDDFKEIK